MSADPRTQQSIDYYNQRASDYVAGTLTAEMTSLYAPFLELVQPGMRILDAGCGSGRDSQFFLSKGYQVTALDAAFEMVKHTSALTGLPVLHMNFNEIEFIESFDAVWACASLLHVALQEMDDAVQRLSRALVPGGIFYVSFKYGEGEKFVDGRLFSYFTEDTFQQMLSRHHELSPVRVWRTSDVRPGHADDCWLNVILRKAE